MDSAKKLGANLRAWRVYVGVARGKAMTLVEAVQLISEEAERLGIGVSRKVPRTHPALIRWEQGDIEHSVLGLSIIATVYGVTTRDLMAEPPQALTPEARPAQDGLTPVVGEVGIYIGDGTWKNAPVKVTGFHADGRALIRRTDKNSSTNPASFKNLVIERGA
jgi:hypothetical protein